MRWEIYLVTDPDLSRGRTHSDVITQAICAGIDAVQLRDKRTPTNRLIEVGRVVREITRNAGVTFIVNDRVDVALAVDADGVHVGQEDMPVAMARRLVGADKIVGASVATVDEAIRAEQEGADYVGVGSIFATSSKSDAGAPIGPAAIRPIKQAVSIPVIAIGGINADNVHEVIQNGADGVAVISAIVSSPDIPEAVRKLRSAIEAARLGQV